MVDQIFFQCGTGYPAKGAAKASEVHLDTPVGFAWAEVSGDATTRGGPCPSLKQGSPTLNLPSVTARTVTDLLAT